MSIFTITVTNQRNKRNKKIIEVSDKISLEKLADKTLESFTFEPDHNFCFTSNLEYAFGPTEKLFESFRDYGDEWTEGAKSVKRNKVEKAFDKVGDRMLFFFDYGANWEFMMELTDIQESSDTPKDFFKLVKSYGKDPVQYPALD